MKGQIVALFSLIILATNISYAQLQGSELSENHTIFKGTFVVNGDKNTYYPVTFKYGNQDVINHLRIFRSYSEAGPDELSPTHKGGLTLEIDLNYGGWGGSSYDWRVTDLRQTYHETFANASHDMHYMGFTIWLRGGGFIYHYESDFQANLQVSYNNDIIYNSYDQAHPEWTVYAQNPITTINRDNINNHLQSITFSKNGNHAIYKQGYVGIGTSTPTNMLDVNGTIRAKEVKVESGWADFVFAPNYQLRSLAEVEEFIDQNGHLPDIPTAKEIEQNGVSLGEINAKLLQKVEELTLYIIQQNKRIDSLANDKNKIRK